jgi:hypothetical protein
MHLESNRALTPKPAAGNLDCVIAMLHDGEVLRSIEALLGDPPVTSARSYFIGLKGW